MLASPCLSDPSSPAASASVPLGGPGTAASRFYNLAQARLSGFPGSEVTLVDFSAENGGSSFSGGAETTRACGSSCSGPGHGHAYKSYAGPSRPKVIPRSYSTPCLRFEGGDAVYDRAERPTRRPGPSASSSLDSPSSSGTPRCEVGADRDVVVDVPIHRCSR